MEYTVLEDWNICSPMTPLFRGVLSHICLTLAMPRNIVFSRVVAFRGYPTVGNDFEASGGKKTMREKKEHRINLFTRLRIRLRDYPALKESE